MARFHHGALMAVAALLLASTARSQLVRPTLQWLDTKTGLSHNQVNALALDSLDQLWMGTSDGLCKFDGGTIRVYRSNGRAGSIANEHIRSLAVGADGLIYVGSDASMLTIVDPRTDSIRNIPLAALRSSPEQACTVDALVADGSTSMLGLLNTGAFFRFDARTRTVRTIKLAISNGA
ncbi:MAG: two-component regulator propeller domain-containing protein, partial [Flavobacteriales bacterium]